MSTPYVYRYNVTASSVDSVPVGTILIDKRRDLTHTWKFMDETSGEITCMTGERFGDRLCPTCYKSLRKATAFGHPGEHENAPKIVVPEVPASDHRRAEG